MNAQRWQQVRALFDEWVDLPPDARRARLAACAAADADLAAEVARMLDADSARDTARFEALALHAADAVVARGDDSGRQIGPWRLLRSLGSGGMGTVYLGERQTPSFTQQAAIKLLRVGWNGNEARRRFEAEQRVLASLQHPNIAHLIDGGIDSDGTPYLALEFVDGLPLGEHVAKADLSPTARVRLFLAACAAVEHAHQHLVVHRDLKPGNILVNREGAIKLLDFGIAKLLDAEGQPPMTSTGVRLYTPGYAAPEQLRGEAVSTATDVYALGVVLYELLTGVLPFEVASASAVDWERVVLTQEPAPPSRHPWRSQIGAAQPKAAWPSGWAGDIDAIVLKCIRREPELRYSSVAELRSDLIALLDGRPVGARRGSRRYRWNKLLRRHALALGLGTVAALALIVGSGISLWQAREAREARARAETQADEARGAAQRAQATVEFMSRVFNAAAPGAADGPEPTARDLLRAGEERIAEDLNLDPRARASMLKAIAHAHMGLGDFDSAFRLLQMAMVSAKASGHLRTEVETMLSFAVALGRQGRNADAMAQYQAADRLLQEQGNQDALLQAYVDRMLAMELLNAERIPEALQRITRAHAVGLAETSPLAPEVIGNLSIHITALYHSGRKQEAVAVTAPSYAALQDAVDISPTDRSTVLTSHAQALRIAGRLDEARAVIEEALRLNLEALGPEHSQIAYVLSLLAGIQREQGQYAASAGNLDRVVLLRRRTLPDDHPTLLNSTASAALSHALAGNLSRARALMDAALMGYSSSQKRENAEAMRARLWNARLLLLEGHEAQARIQLQQVDRAKLDVEQRVEAQMLEQQLGATAPRALDAKAP